MTADQSTTFLRRVLLIDACSSGAMGMAMVAFSSAIGDLLQLPSALIAGAGWALLPFASFVVTCLADDILRASAYMS
jgi:hypothetical protein